jgi:class 3 adenylate cyclase
VGPVSAGADAARNVDSKTRLAVAPSPAHEGERKQVTVLFADVVGFTSMSERFDPETVTEIMGPCFALLTDEIEKYGGTVNTFTGDGCMGLFGAPVAHEDHAARGVHAAWAIAEAVTVYGEAVRRRWDIPFQLRLGLNTGLVVVGSVRGFQMDFTATGDTVNLAARLQVAAQPGTIWVSEATRRAAGETFEWREVGPQLVKGKSVPVNAYEVAGVGANRVRFDVAAQRGLTHFVGRDPEMAKLLEAWNQARAGGGRVVSVVGEAGLGKSRLIHEFKERLRDQDAMFYEGSCFAYGEVFSYLPFLDLLRQMCGLDPGLSVPEAVAAVDSCLVELNAPRGIAPFVHNVLGQPTGEDIVARLSGAVLRQRTVHALRDVIIAAASAGPLVLLVEDLHWIDAASQEVIASVVEAMGPTPLLLVLVYRPEYLQVWGEVVPHARINLGGLVDTNTASMVRTILARSYASSVDLEPFTGRQSEVMVRHFLGDGTVPSEIFDFVADRTEGNPLFVEELTRALLETGVLARVGEGYILTRSLPSVDVPTSVQGVLTQRVDRLDPGLKALLQAASVLGRVFPHRLLASMVEGESLFDHGLDQLAQLEFIYALPASAEQEYSFKHILTQESVYGTLLRRRREAYHHRAGEAIELLYADHLEDHYERLAFHFARSPDDDKAVRYLHLANQKSVRAYSMAEAKAYFDDAVVRLDRMPDTVANRRLRISMINNQFYVFHYLHEPVEYLGILDRYHDLAVELADPALLGSFLQCLGFFQAFGGDDLVGALRTLQDSVAASEVDADPAVGVGYAMLDWLSTWTADYSNARRWGLKAMIAFDRHFELHWCVWARLGFAWSAAQEGQWTTFEREAARALALGEQYEDSAVVSFTCWVTSHSCALLGDFDRSVAFARRALAAAPTPADRLWSSSFLGNALCRSGHPHEALEVLIPLAPIYKAANFTVGCAFNGTFLGEAYLRSDHLANARSILETASADAAKTGARFWRATAERLLGEVAASEGDQATNASRAEAHFWSSASLFTEIAGENELAVTWAAYGRFLANKGDTTLARSNLDRALEVFGRLGSHHEYQRTRDALQALTG